MQYEITKHTRIAPGVFRLALRGDTGKITAPGQFMQVRLPGFFLPRPLSICDWDGDGLALIYKVVGEGTKALAALSPGENLDCLPGLGNGFDVSVPWERPLVIGGGVGAPPLYGLCKALLQRGKRPQVVLGFNSAADIFLRDEFTALSVPVVVATVDGSAGVPGLVIDAIAGLSGYDGFFACGPEKMLRAVADACPCPGQLSFEERMACGFGACMGCSCQTKYGAKRICKDGPVLTTQEVIW